MSPPVESAAYELRPGSSLYYALKAAPPAHQARLNAWVAWWHEVSAIPLAVHDEGVARAKLAWWRDETRRAFDGRPQHPLTRALLSPPGAQSPPQALWLEQLDALDQWLGQTRWLDEVSRRRQALASTGAACEGGAAILGATGEAAAAAARQLGWGLRQAHDLARLGQDARLGRLHVPVSVLQAHEVKAHELLRPVQGQVPPGWPALLAYLHTEAASALDKGLTSINALPAAQRGALRPLRVLARCHRALVDTIATEGSAVLHQRIVLTPVKKWWLAFTTR